MADDNGFTIMIEEFRKQAKDMPEDVSRQMILAAVLGGHKESQAVRQRLRWIIGWLGGLTFLVVFSYILDIAIHGDATWAMNLLSVLR